MIVCFYSEYFYQITIMNSKSIQPFVRQIRIVLIGTTHSGNIGAAARAMKTMQQSDLCLVKPKSYPSDEATARASGADDVLENARVFDSLEQALADCTLVFATTARDRHISWPIHDPRESAAIIQTQPEDAKIAIVFGREKSGMTNEEIDLCNRVVMIPANPVYSSLNLGSAVQLLCYEVMMQHHLQKEPKVKDIHPNEQPATFEEMEGFYQHLQDTMIQTGFYDPKYPKMLNRRIKRLFNRAELERTELNILRGFLASIQEKL